MNDAPALIAEVSQPLAEAKQFRVSTAEHYALAGEKLKGIKALLKKVSDSFDPIIQKAHAAHKEAVARKKEHETPLLEAERLYKRGMIDYQQEQERRAREEQARLEEAARKEREKLEAQAAKAEAKGKVERAEELKTRAEMVAAPVVVSETPKVSGISTRESWRAVVFDKMALIKAVAEGKVPDTILMYDQAALNALARSLKTGLNYPGVRAETFQTIGSKAG